MANRKEPGCGEDSIYGPQEGEHTVTRERIAHALGFSWEGVSVVSPLLPFSFDMRRREEEGTHLVSAPEPHPYVARVPIHAHAWH